MDRIRVGLRVLLWEWDSMPVRGFGFEPGSSLWLLAADGDCLAMC